MAFLTNLHQFLKNFGVSFFKKFRKPVGNFEDLEKKALQGENLLERESEDSLEEVAEEEDKISLAQRTLLTRLYALEQEIEVLKETFPEKYRDYANEIAIYRKTYASDLEKIKNPITFEIDPEWNSQMIRNMNRMEQSVKSFLNYEVKFAMLSKRLQKLIVKLNVLYHVSIFHSNEKEKVISQAKRAILVEKEMVQELKSSELILANTQAKERLVTLISYADYYIFKIMLRNSSFLPQQIFKKLVLAREFKDFDYLQMFKAFLEDELSDLRDLLKAIQKDVYVRFFDQKISDLLEKIVCHVDGKEKLLEDEFWNHVFDLESSLLLFLREHSDLEKEKIKIVLISSMQIEVKENEILTSPKTNAYLNFLSIFAITNDERLWLLIKLFQNVSNEITYKEIYFLCLLFEVLELLQTTSNSLMPYLQKYRTKYSYNSETIRKKKQAVLASKQVKRYCEIFALDEDADKMLAILKRLKIDFQVRNGKVEWNTFYWNQPTLTQERRHKNE